MATSNDTGVKPSKTEKKPAPKAPKKTEQQLRVKFTDEEILKLAWKLAEKNAEAEQAENDKKAVTAQIKAKCDGIASQVSEISGKINARFEYRQVACETTYDDPKPGMKTTRRLDTLEIIEQETMTLAELQQELALGSQGSAVISISTGKPERAPLRTVTASGVVATDEDGKGEDLQDKDAEGV